MSRPAVYLDHNASAPLLPEARAAMVAALDLTGNPSSVHAHGRALRDVVEKARAEVAGLAGAEPGQVVFTGSATEAITQAVVGGARAFAVDAILVSAGEHAAVLKSVEASGLPVMQAGLDGDGRIRTDDVAETLKRADENGQTLLVAVHLVNNETGVIQPLDEIEMLVGPTRHFLFIDAVQGFGKLALDFSSRAPDMMAVSAHKIGGPAGVGALLMKGHADRVRLIHGGGQEAGRRAGTEPAALIAGFGAAAAAFPARYRGAEVETMLAAAESGMLEIAPGLAVFGRGAPRIGNTANFAVPGMANAVAMMGLDLAGVSVSSGSACSSGKVGPSHVLAAMGIEPNLAGCALRLSLGWNTTKQDIEAYLDAFGVVVERHARRHGRAA